ncbi:unnamed protein product [Hermetia illucens]|uniref:Tetraspanin n=1 Tax=Hermetia illucens TaxID=343691 RepID=A0A7R8UW85_HERIL|nr:tetraspanin-2A [Hermetia illucens]CAD7088267.1 unnamed protein product [Hermetia illucens]
MAGQGEGYGKSSATLENRIGCVKYTLFCFNIVSWMFGAALFGLTVWIRAEPGFDEWVRMLNIGVYYIGIYILIGAGVIIMVVSFLGCVSALMENTFALFVFIGTQILSFIIIIAGCGILMDFSTMNSSLQPIITDTMLRLIMQSEVPTSASTLRMVQENIGCCGAAGPNDYILLRQPLPRECRDTVTGNAFFYGCTDELTWFLEDKSGWVAGIAMAVALVNVVTGALSIILVQAIKKEEDEARMYRH